MQGSLQAGRPACRRFVCVAEQGPRCRLRPNAPDLPDRRHRACPNPCLGWGVKLAAMHADKLRHMLSQPVRGW
eukprot:14335087-Alexandrium_andersonii.AAC.1